MTEIRSFMTFTLRKVARPAAGIAGETLVVLSILALYLASYVVIPGAIAIGGSIIAYQAGFPRCIPLAIATLAITAAWMILAVSIAMWTGDSGNTWRKHHPPTR